MVDGQAIFTAATRIASQSNGGRTGRVCLTNKNRAEIWVRPDSERELRGLGFHVDGPRYLVQF